MSANGCSSTDEVLLVVPGGEGDMLGVLSRPTEEAGRRATAVVIVVGGPQTRVGSHRQFVLLARTLAAAGYPCLRFDYSGMGDSPGPMPNFEASGDDIRRACDAVLAAEPDCRNVALWGLCDGATAAVFYAAVDERVVMTIAANPWARSDSTRSAALVNSHYGSRLLSPEFWKKLVGGRVAILATVKEALGHILRARKFARMGAAAARSDVELPVRLAAALRRIYPKVHLQLSGNDLTAAEFEVAMRAAGIMADESLSALRLEEADHTFSDAAAWSAVIDDTLAVLRGCNQHALHRAQD